ncbi:LysR family transcriptional regulator [Chitinimonas koreensis]|uniref:LysR family transcriptional regulator n=1 Tax=Chitinimonas koreensis TaxID=356302 RepID=UPI000420A37C|nr:LysR family transcriptional regulator [Chitinimonas koreensis]QNM98392.1 LysR family transcriptional regulator [Chitinimonas koreensis]
MDRYTQLETFVRVADKGSFAAAAAAEGVTPVVVGRRLDALEARLGVQLFHRSTRRLTLTEAGEGFLARCRPLLADWIEAENAASAARQQAHGQLRVSAPAAFGRSHVAPHATGFLARHPGVRLSFNLTERVVDLVQEGYDLAIRVGEVFDPNYVAIRLHPNRRVVCGTPGYFARHGVPAAPEELAEHNCLAFNAEGGQPRGWHFQRDGRDFSVRVQGDLDCNDGEALQRWVLEGRGLGWRSTWEIQRELARGELVTVLDDYAGPPCDIQAVYPQQSWLPAKVRCFIDYLKTVYAVPGYWDAER